MSTYRKAQERARNKAVEWQMNFNNHDYSCGELVYWQEYFGKLAKRYGLIREFKENGIV